MSFKLKWGNSKDKEPKEKKPKIKTELKEERKPKNQGISLPIPRFEPQVPISSSEQFSSTQSDKFVLHSTMNGKLIKTVCPSPMLIDRKAMILDESKCTSEEEGLIEDDLSKPEPSNLPPASNTTPNKPTLPKVKSEGEATDE